MISDDVDDCLLLTLADRLAAVFLVLKKPLDIRVSSSDLPLWRAGMKKRVFFSYKEKCPDKEEIAVFILTENLVGIMLKLKIRKDITQGS